MAITSASISCKTWPTQVSTARLQQRSGVQNSFAGYTKVNHGNGTFSMRKTGK